MQHSEEICENRWQIKLIAPGDLRASEECNWDRAKALRDKILRDNVWSVPLLVEGVRKIVMDGHHRLLVAQMLNFKYVPCVLLSYEDKRVSVTSWADSSPFDYKTILNAGVTGRLLLYKTTRHHLSEYIPRCDIRLDDLR